MSGPGYCVQSMGGLKYLNLGPLILEWSLFDGHSVESLSKRGPLMEWIHINLKLNKTNLTI